MRDEQRVTSVCDAVFDYIIRYGVLYFMIIVNTMINKIKYTTTQLLWLPYQGAPGSFVSCYRQQINWTALQTAPPSP